MRSFFLLLFAIAIAAAAHAQQPADMQKVQQQLDKARHMLDSLKKKNPNMVLPTLPTSITIPNAAKIRDSLQQVTAARIAALKGYQVQRNQQGGQNLPKKDASRKVTQLPVFTDAGVTSLARQMLPHIIYGLDSTDLLLRGKLDKIANDPNSNVAGTGALLLTMGISRYSGEYLICKAIIANPKDIWGLNDFGIVLRNEVKYKEAIQVFTYACSFSDSLYVVQANLGWTCAYYGDFENAQKWFNKALTINLGYNSAMEGLAMIAYQQGDLQALFACLAKEVKSVGGSGPGPSNEFASLCGGVSSNQDMGNIGGTAQQTDPSTDHTYDDPDGDKDNEEVTENNGEEPVSYPSMGSMFANSVDNLISILPRTSGYFASIKKASADSRAVVTAKTASLTPLHTAPKYDADGNRAGTYDFSRFNTIFHQVHLAFEKRAEYIFRAYESKMRPVLDNMSAHDGDMLKDYYSKLGACTTAQCQQEVQCDFKPKFTGGLATDLGAISALWSKSFSDLIDAENWYISASSPFIKRMKQDDWNSYMNATREDDVRQAVLTMYNKWLEAQGRAGAPTAKLVQYLEPLACVTQVREIEATGPDPSTVKLKKLKTAPEYCDPDVSSFGHDLGIASVSGDCTGWKVSIGGDDHNLFLSKIYGKHQEDDKMRAGASVGFGFNKEVSAMGQTLSAGVKAQIEAGYEFDSTGAIDAQFANAQISAGISGSLSTGNSTADKTLTAGGASLSASYGVSAQVSVIVAKGPDGYGAPVVSGSASGFGKQ